MRTFIRKKADSQIKRKLKPDKKVNGLKNEYGVFTFNQCIKKLPRPSKERVGVRAYPIVN